MLNGQYPVEVEDRGIPCSDAAAEVVAIGDAVKDFAIGDHVSVIFDLHNLSGYDDAPSRALGGDVDGVLREYAIYEDKHLVLFPKHLSWEEAATITCAGVTACTALNGLKSTGTPRSALLQGTGGVSMFALLICIAAGIRPIITPSSDKKLEDIRKLGSDVHTINYKTVSDQASEVKRHTDGKGVDFVINNTGPGSIPEDIRFLRQRGGVISLVGFLNGTDGDWQPSAIMELMGKSAILKGIAVGAREEYLELNKFLAEKKVSLAPLVDRVFSFDESPAAFDYLYSGSHCLQQVIGILDNNSVGQYSACVAQFGSPSTLTIVSTTTTTVLYTDIVITVSTTSSTQYDTSTSYAELVETVADYSATSVATVTEVVTAPTTPVQPIKMKRSHKKRGCQRRSSNLSSSSAPAATSSDAPNCANLEEYSSACSCIYAVSSTATLTNSVPARTEVVAVTESSPILSTSTSVVTVVVSRTIIVLATTTITSTTTGLYLTTTTVTSTTTPVAPTQTSYLVVDSGPRQGKYLTVVNRFLQYESGNSGSSVAHQLFNVPAEAGQPSPANDPSLKMFLHNPSVAIGVLYFETETAAAAANDPAVICTLVSGVVSCTAPSKGFDTIFICGAYNYLAKSTFNQNGCSPIKWKLST
ncbi:hypothetical protein VTI74DRAFT_6378 [Chaetomium olivicolor]